MKPPRFSVNVVIPVYKAQLTANELVSLRQCLRVLGNYPIWLAAPHSLDLTHYRETAPSIRVRTFDEHYFADIQSYNRLMLTEEFYEAFADADYMLIHQLDAFVFRDDLADWCRRDYDYIGAPWLRDRDFTGWRDRSWFQVKK